MTTLTLSRSRLLTRTRSESMVFPHLWSVFEVCSPSCHQGPQRGLESGELSVALLVSEVHATTGDIQILVASATIWDHVTSKPELQLMALSGSVVSLQSLSALPQKFTHKSEDRATMLLVSSSYATTRLTCWRVMLICSQPLASLDLK